MSGSRVVAVLALAGVGALSSAAGGKKDDARPYAIVSGTVFRDPGYALAGATVTLMLRAEPKPKKVDQAVSTARGEFSFRVPTATATYVVRAALKGYQTLEKEVEVSGEDHVAVTLTLEPQSK